MGKNDQIDEGLPNKNRKTIKSELRMSALAASGGVNGVKRSNNTIPVEFNFSRADFPEKVRGFPFGAILKGNKPHFSPNFYTSIDQQTDNL